MAKANGLLQTIREDDFVEYYLFPQVEAKDELDEELFLRAFLGEVNQVVDKYSAGYLWHRDPIQLSPRTSSSHMLIEQDCTEELPPHLYGVTHYGDNIEDEWFIVFILMEVSKSMPGVVVKILDSDGEFLLIEAADYLPEWATPEICNNRVYIYEGNVHLLTPPDDDNSEDVEMSVAVGLHQVRSHPERTVANKFVQKSIRDRLSTYPVDLERNFHHASVYVPTAVAAILKTKPELISAAVLAFCNRDPVDLKACRAMKYFPPEQRVKVRVKFTKCLYAMLQHSKYVPERRIGWNLPPVNYPEHGRHLLGVKVACGFEILAAQARSGGDPENDKAWARYLESLRDKGYFQGLLEGSRDHNDRLNKAKEFYAEHRDSMHHSSAKGQDVLGLLRSLEVDYEKLRKEGENLPPDDDDSWLRISSESLEAMLQERYGQKKMFKVNEDTNPADFADKVNRFLTRLSDVDGVDFPDPEPQTPPRSRRQNSDSKNAHRVSFDPDAFTNALQNILNLNLPEDDALESDSDDMSEYEHDDFVRESEMNGGEAKSKMQQYMDRMDLELSTTTVGRSFEKSDKNAFDDIENFQPVDIDVNALKNILESYRSQMGEAGPSSNMLGPMGVHLDPKS